METLECLASLLASSYTALYVILVDNGSTDGTLEAIRTRFPTIETIPLGENLGFARACNIGIRRALDLGAAYVLLLNNDTTVDPEMVAHLIQAGENFPRAGMLAPLIYYTEENDRIWSSGFSCHPITLGTHPIRPPYDHLPYEVDFLVGCGLLVKRPVFDTLGLFDERFFMYYEDLDLCLRARRQGYQLLTVPRARMWHKVSASVGGEGSPFEAYYKAQSSVLFYAKHTHPVLRPTILIYRTGSAIRKIASALLTGRLTIVQPYLQGLAKGIQLTK